MSVLEDAEAVASLAAETVALALAEGARSLVLTGGTTPRRMYGLLAAKPVEWGRVTLLFGDERCVAPDDPESNYRMARETLLSSVDAGAVLHAVFVKRHEHSILFDQAFRIFFRRRGYIEKLIASMLPGTPTGAPKPPPDRVSLTLGCLRNARRVIFLVTGEAKADAYRRARRGEVPAGMIPRAEWIVDRAAAS